MGVPRTSNRREFLHGKSAVDALADLAERVSLAGAPVDPPGVADRYLVKLARRAMACQFEVFLNAGQYGQGARTALAGLDLVEELEAQLSVFRESSEVSHVNRQAAAGPVAVESRLFDLFVECGRLHVETGGVFDITSGPLSKAWGFSRRAGAIPTDDELAAARQCVGARHVRLDAETRSIAFDRPAVEINLGAIGKGYAIDRCGELCLSAGVENYLWHGGQSSALARGARAGDEAWTVGLRHPLRPDRLLARIRLRNAALGTSGAGAQFFRHGGRRYGHILDPRTGWPASGVFSCTVVAPTAALADAFSTAFYILGPERAQACCEAREGLGFLMLLPNATGSAVEIASHGIDATMGDGAK